MIDLLLQALISPSYKVYSYDKVHLHPKACAVGKVVYARKMEDKDWHITIIDGMERKLVLEFVPEIEMQRPKKGNLIKACGIGRYDTKHKWNEIHPVLFWSLEK